MKQPQTNDYRIIRNFAQSLNNLERYCDILKRDSLLGRFSDVQLSSPLEEIRRHCSE